MPEKRNLTLRLPQELYEALKQDAADNLRCMSHTVQVILRSHYNKEPAPAPADRDLQERLRDTVRGGIGS